MRGRCRVRSSLHTLGCGRTLYGSGARLVQGCPEESRAWPRPRLPPEVSWSGCTASVPRERQRWLTRARRQLDGLRRWALLFLPYALEGLPIALLIHELAGIGVPLNPLLRRGVECLRTLPDSTIAVSITFGRVCSHVITCLNRLSKARYSKGAAPGTFDVGWMLYDHNDR